jgi:hypothetical protein
VEASLLFDQFSMEWKLSCINPDRPYCTEEAALTLEELVGASELHYVFANIYGDHEEINAQLTEFFNELDPLTHPISIEEENQRMLQEISSTLPKLIPIAVDLGSLDCGNANVLLTRAERHRSKSLREPLLERVSGREVRSDGGDCTAQSQTAERSIVDRPSEVLTRCFMLPSLT